MNLNQKISSIEGCELTENKDLTSFTTFRLASIGTLIEVISIKALQELIKLLNHEKSEYLIIGWGANQILPSVCKAFVIHLKFPFDQSYLETTREEYELPASLGLNYLTAHASKFSLKGWEVFTGIPASLGGAIYMNAGTALGEIGSIIKSVKIVTPEGELREESINASSFSYRKNNFVKPGEVIVGATLINMGQEEGISQKIKQYMEYRKNSQPLSTKNCGCVFKNPMRDLQAGRLIDLLNLKGVGTSDLKVSTKHANFMENTGKANWDQFRDLVSLINFEMDHFYGIEFELEVKIPYH